LIGSAMPPLKESFYVDGHLILTRSYLKI
jgi:hypothetical protein